CYVYRGCADKRDRLLLPLPLQSLDLSATGVKYRLGITVGRLPSLQDEIQSRLKGDAPLVIRRHITVVGIALILPIDDLRHSFKSVDDLVLREDAVLQPVGDVLARNSERGSIFHQSYVFYIRDLRAADALIDPANHVS